MENRKRQIRLRTGVLIALAIVLAVGLPKAHSTSSVTHESTVSGQITREFFGFDLATQDVQLRREVLSLMNEDTVGFGLVGLGLGEYCPQVERALGYITSFTSSGISKAYLLSFHACDTATANCRDPRNHQVYLAQSNDGASWSLVPGWMPYPGSVPDVIRRGDTLYVYTPDQVRRYRFATQTWEAPVRVSLNDPTAPGFVDPSLFVDDQGRLVLFYLVATPGSDPAQCAPGQPTCVKRFHSATEAPGSDGTAFVAEPGDRVAITLHPNPIDSASDPDIFIEAVRSTTRYVLYISRGNSIQIYTSLTLHGSYTLLTTLPEGYLTRNTGGIGSGHFDFVANRYWTYVHTPNGIIRRAAHSTLDEQLAEDDFTAIITGSSIGLGSSWRVESPGFAVNAAGPAITSDGGTLEKIYFQISLNINYSRDPAEQQKITQTIRKHLDLMSKYAIKANYYFTGLAAEMIQEIDPTLIALLKEKSTAKLLALGHHGANRPPRPMPIDRVRGQNWEEDVKAILNYESCALDPVTGQLDCSRPGGLKNMTENIFKQPLFSTGRFFQASILYATKQFGVKMAVGLQDNTGAPRGDAWFLGILNRPDGVVISPEMLMRWAQGGTSPLPALEQRIASLDKSRIRLVSLLIHDTDFFRNRTTAQTEQIWQKYEEFLKWALARGYQIVSVEDLYNMALDDRERTITKAELQKIAEFYTKQVEGTSPHYPPDYIDLGNDYFSLADAWQALAQALAHYQQKGSLPDSVVAKDILGPTVLVKLETMPRTISADDILKSATVEASRLKDRVPSSVKLEQAMIEINASEHLYLMAKEFLSLLAGAPTPVEIFKIGMISKNVEAIRSDPNDPRVRRADPLTKQQFWTFKPARWK